MSLSLSKARVCLPLHGFNCLIVSLAVTLSTFREPRLTQLHTVLFNKGPKSSNTLAWRTYKPSRTKSSLRAFWQQGANELRAKQISTTVLIYPVKTLIWLCKSVQSLGLKCCCPRTYPESPPPESSSHSHSLFQRVVFPIHFYHLSIASYLHFLFLLLVFPIPLHVLYMGVKCNSVDILMDGKRPNWSKKMKGLDVVWFPLVFVSWTESPVDVTKTAQNTYNTVLLKPNSSFFREKNNVIWQVIWCVVS